MEFQIGQENVRGNFLSLRH